jgi:hypothetical protein
VTPIIVNPFVFAGSGFTDPGDIASCKIWCETDVGLFSDSGLTTPQASNGGVVKGWTNQLGSNHLTRAVGNGPTLDTGTTLNGYSTLQFTSGTLQCLDFPNFFTGDAAGEMFAVVKMDADPQGAAADTGFMYLGSAAFNTHYPFTDSVVYDGFGTSTRKTVGNIAPNLAAWHTYNPWSAPSDWNLNIDNVSVYSTASNTVGWNAGPLLGVSGGSGFTGSQMRLAAVYYFGDKLTSGERSFMYSYILAKYGI